MNEDFCKNLKKIRLEKGYSQKDFAEKLGVAKSTYCMYENGYREPNVDTIKKIADLLGVSIDDLFGIDNSPAVSKAEFSDLVQKYRVLDADGKETVDFILNKEYKRCLDGYLIKTQNGITYVEETRKKQSADRVTAYVNAAHADDYANAPEELKKQEEDIMDDEDF